MESLVSVRRKNPTDHIKYINNALEALNFELERTSKLYESSHLNNEDLLDINIILSSAVENISKINRK